MWRSKSAILSTLYQTLTDRQVTLMKERFKKYQEKVDNPQSTIVMDFEGSIKQLTKMYNEAKDNVKFLTTLERQFRALGTTGLVGV
jgi:dynein heavy chain